ncbi:sigma factor-like helix-turn-helix DNA-binding protein [Mucilaginibacter terrae]|uniref:sigma factor-like helix-turn-helix DNA-binding protein n=1 Tax=Mucilaginibacter terrae TaxID=1955052 RepID=UPI003629E4DB
MDLKFNQPQSTVNNYNATYALYQRYGSLLLGYITEVLKDANLAEQCLIEVFKQVQAKVGEYVYADNPWLKLQRLTRNVICSHHKPAVTKENGSDSWTAAANKYTGLMSAEQQQVFCGIHYQQKNLDMLATELNKTQEHIRQLLREALIIIRNEQKR